jgi:hypothetical protein
VDFIGSGFKIENPDKGLDKLYKCSIFERSAIEHFHERMSTKK